MSRWDWDDIGHAIGLIIFFGLLMYAMVHMASNCKYQC